MRAQRISLRGSSILVSCPEIPRPSPSLLHADNSTLYLKSRLPSISSSTRVASFSTPGILADSLDCSEFSGPDAEGADDFDPFAETAQKKQIASRQSDYHLRRFNRETGSEKQVDAFGQTGEAGEGESGYAQRMRQAELEREEQRVARAIEEQQREKREQAKELGGAVAAPDATPRKRRWDVTADDSENIAPKAEEKSNWDLQGEQQPPAEAPAKKRRSRWDQTPLGNASPNSMANQANGGVAATPKRSRWDQTPVASQSNGGASADGAGNIQMINGVPTMMMPLSSMSAYDKANRYLSDEELNEMLPSDGYEIVPVPESYQPIRAAGHKLMATPGSSTQTGFMMQDEKAGPDVAAALATPELSTDVPGVGSLAFLKQEDAVYFGKIMNTTEDSKAELELSVEELKERKILRLLLKIKNGTPPMRKSALRQITDKARDFGPGALFDKILPLLMERTLEDQERHLLVKVIDRVLYKLDDLVRPYVHKILVVIEPLLIDEDYYARVEGREIISNLSKAAGLAHMISTMRPDIDHVDEYVRNTTARAFAVVASALGIPALLPFLKAVCRSKKSWQARHTGIKIVQQIAIMLGCAVLPHLKNLVESIAHGLEDEQLKVRTMTALAIAALAEAAAPYGIESFDSVLKPLWTGIRKHRGKGLAAFLKAIGFIIPLMDAEYANYYTKEVMIILIREFQSPDEEMKKIVLKVVKQCAATEGVQPAYVKNDILPEFFKHFWVRRMALDRRNYRQVVETTVELAQKAGVSEIVGRVVNDLKDESEPYRKMVMETIDKVIQSLGAADVDERLEVLLIDGIIYAFQEQSVEDHIMLEGFGTVVNSLGDRVKPYLTQIVSTILWRLNNKSAKVRQQAADLTSKLAVVIKQCGEDSLLNKLGVVLFEQLGEEYPDTLGSIIAAEGAIANVVGMQQMAPPVKDLCRSLIVYLLSPL